MGFIVGLLKRICKLIIYSAVVIAVILFVPNLPPYSSFSSIEIEPTQPRIGPLAPNGHLNNAEKVYSGKLLGPECFQIYNGEIYTGLATGEIVKISPGGHVTFVTKLGQPCSGLVQEHICGRPLGFVIDEKQKQMYVADAYHGIWKVDLKTDKKQLLVSPGVEIDGKAPKFFNSVALDRNSGLYWTDSSSDYEIKDGVYAFLADPAGRLFYYNEAKNVSKVLLDDLWFANGVVVSPDNQFVVVAETNRLRLTKYYINGPNKGSSAVFVAGLPGAPDNLRVLPDGSGLLASLYVTFDEDHPLLTAALARTPSARKFLSRASKLVEIPFKFLNKFFPNPVFEDILYFIGHFESISGLMPAMSGMVQMDWNGNIIASYYNTDGSLGAISDGIVYNDKLYTGSPHGQDFVGAVPAPPLLKKAFTSPRPVTTSQPDEKKTTTKPTNEAPKQNKPVQPTTDKPKVEKDNQIPKVSEKIQKIATPAPPQQKKVEPKTAETKEPIKKVETKPMKEESKVKIEKKETVTQSATVSKENIEKPQLQKTVSKESEKKSSDVKKENEKLKTVTKEPVAKPTSKQPETKPTSPQPAAKKSAPENKPKIKKSEEKNPKPTNSKPTPEEIPIVEEIPSDTAKPNKDTLKVIKKSGPVEIPNPQ